MTIKLKSGVSVHGDKLRVNISYRGARYRLSTIYPATQANVAKAYALAQSIKLDLTRGLFYLVNYKNKIPNIEILAEYDSDYVEKKNTVYFDNLLSEQLKRYQQLLANQQLKYSTVRNYEYVISKYLTNYFGDIALQELSVKDLEQFIASIKLSKSRINTILRPMRDIIRREKKGGRLDVDVFDLLDNNEIKTHAINSTYEIEPFNSTEKEAIINNSDGQLRNIIQFGFWTGMRIGEIIALTWSDVDFDKEKIHVNKSKTLGRLGTPKTKAGMRDVEMTKLALEALLDQKQYTYDAGVEIFHNPRTNKPWSKSDVFARYWYQILDNAKVKHRNPHQMRHTFISYMLSRGNKPEVLYKMVGHTNTEMIYKVYGKFIAGEQIGKLLIE